MIQKYLDFSCILISTKDLVSCIEISMKNQGFMCRNKVWKKMQLYAEKKHISLDKGKEFACNASFSVHIFQLVKIKQSKYMYQTSGFPWINV